MGDQRNHEHEHDQRHAGPKPQRPTADTRDATEGASDTDTTARDTTDDAGAAGEQWAARERKQNSSLSLARHRCTAPRFSTAAFQPRRSSNWGVR